VHLYLFTLEITPLELRRVYDELPSHLTLMSRFLSDLSPDELVAKVQPLFTRTASIQLVFDKTTVLGPKKVTAHMVTGPQERQLHNQLRELLGKIRVNYQYPEFIGDNHKPHVTAREGVQFARAGEYVAPAAYLIEIVDGKRAIRAKFKLKET
jgi:2'-5' RNA ligase